MICGHRVVAIATAECAMAERDVLVLEIQPGWLRLQPLGTACRDCSSGCAGRCRLFATDEDISFELHASEDKPEIGSRLRLCIDDAALRRAAWAGYGRALCGLLLGAGFGHLTGLMSGFATNLSTLAGLLLGTFLALFFSKPALPPLRLRPELPQKTSNECQKP